MYVKSKTSSSASSSLEYVNVDFNNNKLSTWYSKEFTISLNASNFNTTGGRLYGQFSITSSSGGVIMGNIIPIKVVPIPPISNNSISGNLTINEGQSVSIIGSNPSGGLGNYSFEWQKKEANGTWVNIAGAIGSNLSSDMPLVTTSYKRIVKSSSLSSFSNELNITVNPAPPIQNNTITLSGSEVQGSIPTGGTGTYTYRWLIYAVEGEVPGIAVETTKDYIVPASLYYWTTINNVYIERQVSSGSKTSISNYILLSPAQEIQNNIITLSGQNITGSLPTGGTGNFRYEYLMAQSFNGEPLDVQSIGTGQNFTISSYGGLTTEIYRIVYSGNKVSTSNIITIPPYSSFAKKETTNMEEIALASLTVYPNPTSESINFSTNFSVNKEIEIIIYSEKLGNPKSVFKGTVTPNQNVKWSIPENYQKGLYFYKITADNKEVKYGKIIYQ